MADGPVISTSIEMLGAKEYSSALRNINADLSLLSKGLKASQSAFKDLDGADALRDRLEGLNKIYDQHKTKVALITRQLEAAKAKYGENSTQVRTLQTALYAAQTAMNNCGREIAETEDRLNGLAEGEEDAGKQAEKMGKELDKSSKKTKDQGKEAEKSSGLLKKLGGAMLDVAKGAAKMAAVGTVAFMAGTAAAATQATKALISCAGAGAAYADDMLTMAVQTGISLSTLQELAYAAPLVDVSLDTMVSSMSKLTREMGSMDKNGVKASDALTRMGLTIYDTNGQLKTSEDMFWEVIYALGQIENPTERDALAMELFGKSAQELNPLIAASTQGMRDLSAEAQSMGVVLSDKAMETLGEYQNSLDRFNGAWDGFKHQLGANVSGLFKPFVDDATSAVARVNVLLSDGWQDTDADKLAQILGGVWDKFVGDAKNLWTKLAPVISEVVGSVKAYLDQNLPTMLGNLGDLIKTAIGDLTSMAEALVNGIDWSQVGTLLNDLLIGAAGIFTTLVSKLPEIFSNIEWGDVFGALLILAETAVKSILECFGIDWKGVTNGWNELVTECEQLWEDVKAIWNGVGEFFGGVAGSIASFFEKAWHDIKAAWTGVEKFFSGLFEGITGWFDTAIGDLGQWAADKWNSIKSAWSDVSGFVSDTWSNFTGWVDQKLGLDTWAGKQWNNIKTAWSGVSELVSAKWNNFTNLISGKINLSAWAAREWRVIKSAWSTVRDFVSNTWSNFTGWIDEKLGISEWASGVWDTIKGAWSVTSIFVSDTWSSVTGWIDEKLGLSSWGEAIKRSFSSIFGDAAGAIESAFAGIGKFFTDIWYDIVGTCVDALNTLIDGWNTVGDLVGLGIGRIDWTDPRNANSGQRAIEELTRHGGGRGGTSTVSYDISGWHEDAKAMLKDFREAMQQFFEAGAIDAQTNGREMAEKYIASFCNGAYAGNPEIIAMFTQVFNEIVGKAEESAGDMEDAGEDLAASLAKGINNRKKDVTSATSSTMSAAQRIAAQAAGGFNTIGVQAAAGLASGIAAGASRAVAAVQSLGSSIISAMQGKLKINSPSKVFEWMGEMSGQGYQIGLEESMAGIDALGSLGSGRGVYPGAGLSGGDGIDYNRLGEAVVQALKREGVGTAVMYVDGKELGRSTERGVSAENYDRQVSGYRGRSAALRVG